VSSHSLDATAIIKTARRLEQRVHERFPASSLLSVCRDLISLAEQSQQRAAAIAKPHLAVRAAVYITIAAGIGGLLWIVPVAIDMPLGSPEMLTMVQGVQAAASMVVLIGSALYFLVSLETRIKRTRALRDLHAFRSVAHVIDMHQLTKDPSSIIAGGPPTSSSPERTMSPFELTRYLDYCTEMLSITSKLAALYAQNLPDAVIIEAVNDIERLTTNLSQKMWQKITILDAGRM
jgi:hypothetical protein